MTVAATSTTQAGEQPRWLGCECCGLVSALATAAKRTMPASSTTT